MNKARYVLLIASLTLVSLCALSCSEPSVKNGCLDNEDWSDSEIAYCDGIEYNFYSYYCSSGKIIAKEEFTDSRDGQKYRYVTIGSQIWMADNLNYAVDGSICHYSSHENLGNCEKYGKFYDWAMAMDIDKQYNSDSYMVDKVHQGICPDGWHLPSFYEWESLSYYIVHDSEKLKAKCGWPKRNSGQSGNGTDDYGFSAQPFGYFHYDFAYFHASNYSDWWTSNESNAFKGDACEYFMDNHSSLMYMGISHKNDLLSVRCIKD
jgi:uncharacterized protein (TIGR02145 family)